jgi:hypothetical protein
LPTRLTSRRFLTLPGFPSSLRTTADWSEFFLFHLSERQRARERLYHNFEQASDGIQLFGWQRIQQCVGPSALLIEIRLHGCALSADFSLRDSLIGGPGRVRTDDLFHAMAHAFSSRWILNDR